LVFTNEHLTLLEEALQDHIKKACTKYEWLKWEDLQHDTWLAQVVEAKAEAQKGTPKTIWKQICNTKCTLVTARQSNMIWVKWAPTEAYPQLLG